LEGLRALFVILNVPVRQMDFETYKSILPYVNKTNSKKFNPITTGT
jgi:hypothetical protein